MTTTMTATFDIRREAEMTVERLVQEYGIDRATIVIAAEGDENTAGRERAGSDGDAGEHRSESRAGARLNGAVIISVAIMDDAKLAQIRDAFGEYDAAGVVEQ